MQNFTETSAKRKRGANFTKEESATLVNLVDQFTLIVENKKTNGTTTKEKDQAWEKITHSFNAATASCRNVKQLKEKYENLKKEAKKMLGREREETLKTGGGPATRVPQDSILEKVVGIMGVSAGGMPSTYDCDDANEMCIEEEEDAAATGGEEKELPIIQVEEVLPLQSNDSVVQQSEIQDWSMYTPAMLKRKRNSNLIVTPNSRRRPQMGESAVAPSASGQKLHSWASARTEVAQLQKELLLKEFEAKQERERELHIFNIQIKEEELRLIKAKRKLVEMDVEERERASKR